MKTLADEVREIPYRIREVAELSGLIGTAIAKITFLSDDEKEALIGYLCHEAYGLRGREADALKAFINAIHDMD